MKTSKEARKVSRELFRACLKDGRIDEGNVRLIASRLSETKPRHYIDILHNLERLVRLEVQKRQAVVESAFALDEGTQQQLRQSLSQRYGGEVATEFKVSPELIGGLRVKIGSDVFDSTVRERLNRLESAVMHA